MAFDQTTRNRLQRLVSDVRTLLTDEFTRQLQQEYGLDPKTGEAADLYKLSHLDDSHLETARVLREILAHYLASEVAGSGKKGQKDALDRIVREQAFTVLNRLAALRMMEARGLLRESIANGYQSQGFQLYERLAGHALGETGDAYRCYLFSLFDEFALDLKVLFDRYAPQGLLFPRESALLELLDLLNEGDIEALWGEDETIGWLYQYFNSTEERKKMRKESAAPRNSRELAVRNQFFTPRYVVEFLTDNTLGRIWYEMTCGQTRLADQCRYLVRRPTEIFLAEGEAAPETPDQEGLSQEELLKQPVHIPHRPLKDPREIRLLDPACGSMHFGLYAFDLFEIIYEEAWDNGSCPALQDDYSSNDEFLKDVLRLIIEHNIHGIDIDPRAVQIAGLSLWLRAQNAWQSSGVKPAERPRIRRSNVVCAEPMPGSQEMQEEFIATLDPPLLGELVKTVFDKMQLAGEAGSLLKIEEEIRTAIDNSRKEWLKQQDDLFTRKEDSQEAFFESAEQQVIDALRAYAEQADADSYQRRLFADDAARGFAFIDLCRKRYDAVVMNPPFGEASEKLMTLSESNYPMWNQNLLCAFIARAFEHREDSGKVGVIFDRTAVVKSTYEGFRQETLLHQKIESILDLGWNVLDANVEVISLTLGGANYSTNDHTSCIDVRLVDPDSKATATAEALFANSSSLIVRNQRSFAALPNQVIGYDFPETLLEIFLRFPTLKAGGAKANPGLQVKMDRYARLRCEVNAHDFANERYINMYNGSPFCRFYTPSVDCQLWEKTGEKLKAHPSTRWNNPSRYKCAGVGYGKRGNTLDAHVMPSNFVFTTEGLAVFPSKREHFYYYLAILNAPLTSWIINYFCGQHKHAGYVDLIPVPPPGDCAEFSDIDRQAQEVVAEKLRFNACYEVGALFTTPWHTITSLPEHEIISGISDALSLQALAANECVADLERSVENAYQLSASERAWLRPNLEPHFGDVVSPYQSELISFEDPTPFTSSLLSYALGDTLGRWDIRYATGERQPPELPDPFDPLPVCPPGMLQNAKGLPAEPKDVPADYPLRISWPGILVDDENHPEDIVVRVREAIEVIWPGSAGSGSRAEAIEQEACEILGVRTLRDYFRRPTAFFADHLKRYSKSRRKAPIYWPLSTKSGSYTLWLYYHRLNDQILYICVNDFVEPKLQQVTGNLESLRKKSDRTSKDEKDLSMFFDLKVEFEEYRDDLLRVAKFWKPDLNDGVQITAAPLWPLFRHNPWRKVLKDTWKKLEKGDYDWAHLAMSYWPDRVREKCKTDKSLAIAHGLEGLYENPPAQPTKKRGRKPSGELR